MLEGIDGTDALNIQHAILQQQKTPPTLSLSKGCTLLRVSAHSLKKKDSPSTSSGKTGFGVDVWR